MQKNIAMILTAESFFGNICKSYVSLGVEFYNIRGKLIDIVYKPFKM